MIIFVFLTLIVDHFVPMPVNETVILDLDAIVENRFGDKKIPKPLVRWLKKFIHQDHMNGYLKQGWLGVEFAEQALVYYDVHLTVKGLENIPDDGRYTFAGNHPLGGIDALSVIGQVGRKFDGNIVIPANDLLMAIKPIAEYTVPVNKLGGQSADLVGKINDAFNSDRQVIIFPAGLCSRKIDGVVQDLPWKKTFITKSRESQRDIIPMWFSGHNSKRFYRVDAFCKFFGIKFPLAMLCLPDEVFRCRNKSFQVRIGKPIPWETFTKDKKDIEWANEVRKVCYALGEE